MRNATVVTVIVTCSVLLGGVASAQSVLAVGSVEARAGQTVVVPVYLKDATGTPLGSEVGFGHAIQGIAFKVRVEPAGAVQSLTVHKAGILTQVTPLFEATPRAADAASLILSADESSSPLPITRDPAGEGDLVAQIEVQLAPTVTGGQKITLSLDPTVTALSNQAGTELETPANGALRLQNGEITLGGPRAPRQRLH